MEGLVGASSALCENMGHTYNSLGEYDEAAARFKKALECLDNERKPGNRAGILLGLGLIEDRRGNYKEALKSCREAQTLFRERAQGKPASLIAKAGMSIARILLKIANSEEDEARRVEMEEEAIEQGRDNVEIFKVTCGDESPLTASALMGLGKALVRRGQLSEAQASFAESYRLEAIKDAFDLLTVMEVHNALVHAHTVTCAETGLDRTAFASYIPTVELTLERVRALPQDGNAGAYYKVAGELMAFAGDLERASSLLGTAIELFKTEEADLVSGLIETCSTLREFCLKQVEGAQTCGKNVDTGSNVEVR